MSIEPGRGAPETEKARDPGRGESGRKQAGSLGSRVGLLAVAICVGMMPHGDVRAAKPPGPGDEAPPILLEDLEGREVSLAEFKDRPLILHFWATWCPVCREEMPILEQAARDRPGNLAVLGINLGEKREKVAAYVRQAGLTFPVLLDLRGKVAARYGVLSLPITILVGPDGRIAGSLTMGSLTRERLAERLGLLKTGGGSDP